MASNLLIDDMKNESSDSDDADYVPTGEHDSGEDSIPEDEIGTDEEAIENSSKSKVRAKRKSKKRKETPVVEPEPEPELDVTDLTNESARKRADELYKQFLLDVENENKPSNISITTNGSGGSANSTNVATTAQTSDKKSAPEFFEFAGEIISTVKGNIVSTESHIPVSSAKGMLPKKPEGTPANEGASTSAASAAPVVKRKGGLNAVLAIIQKKKLSTLQKSHMDWKQFKAMNDLNEELAVHNRGKDSYVEKKRFLERTDLRTFEIEKNARLKKRK